MRNRKKLRRKRAIKELSKILIAIKRKNCIAVCGIFSYKESIMKFHRLKSDILCKYKVHKIYYKSWNK